MIPVGTQIESFFIFLIFISLYRRSIPPVRDHLTVVAVNSIVLHEPNVTLYDKNLGTDTGEMPYVSW